MIGPGRSIAQRLPGVRTVQRWRLWTLPASATAFLLTVECVAFLTTASLLSIEPLRQSWIVRFAVLAVLGVGYTEIATRSTRMQRYLGTDKIVSNPMSVWSFAAVLTVPAGWAAALIALQYLQSLLRWRRDTVGHPHRIVFTAAATMLAQLGAAGVVGFGAQYAGGRAHAASDLFAVAGVGVFVALNSAVVLFGMWLAIRPPMIRSVLPSYETVIFEVATLVLGIVTAEFMLHAPVLVPTVLVLVAVLHRSSVVKSLQVLARTDTKTGLLNPAAWTDSARSALSASARTGDAVTILLIDLDRFKAINDRHGHLAGDQVLAAVGGCLRQELRGHDAVGRFGGEEFVAVLLGPTETAAAEIASRLCAAIGALTVGADQLCVTASIGLAHYQPPAPNGVADIAELLDALLRQADTGLYEAKQAGRNQVRLAGSAGPLPRCGPEAVA